MFVQGIGKPLCKPLVEWLEQRLGKYETVTEDVDETEEEEMGRKKNPFHPPTIEEVRVYCREKGNRVNQKKFVDHYQSVGWRRGKTPMVDCKATVRTWKEKDKEVQSGRNVNSDTIGIKQSYR